MNKEDNVWPQGISSWKTTRRRKDNQEGAPVRELTWWGQWEEKTDVSNLQFEEITLYLVAPGTHLWYKAAHWLLLTCISVPQGY